MRRFLMTCLGTIAAVMMTVTAGVILPSRATARAMAPIVDAQATAAWDGRKL